MENKKEEVEKLLRTHLGLMTNGAFETNTDPAIIADRIVKLFAIPVVSKRSELALHALRRMWNGGSKRTEEEDNLIAQFFKG